MFTREQLIEICEKAIVPESKWSNRDSQSSQVQVGECWALLKAQCDFEVKVMENRTVGDNVSDEDTIWLEIYSNGFQKKEDSDCEKDVDIFYLPTLKRLKNVHGGDWY